MAKKAIPAELSEYFAKIGKKGGKKGGVVRASKMTEAERSESARKAIQARWAKVRAKKAKKSD
jgi:hypothetical protein